MLDDTINNRPDVSVDGGSTDTGGTDVGGADVVEIATRPEDLTLPISDNEISYNGWRTVTDWLSATPTSGKLPDNNTISFKAKSAHTGRLERTGTLKISYWGASESDKNTQIVTIKQKAMDTYSATEFWICVPKNNSQTEYLKYPTKAESTITIASDVKHIKLLTRTNLNVESLKIAFDNLNVSGSVLKYNSTQNSSHFYNCTLDKSLHDTDMVPRDFTSDLLDKFTEKAYMYVATTIGVNNISSVSESGTIHIANEIQHWGDERINRVITITKTQTPTFNVTTPSDIEAGSTDASNITLTGTNGTNWSSTIS